MADWKTSSTLAIKYFASSSDLQYGLILVNWASQVELAYSHWFRIIILSFESPILIPFPLKEIIPTLMENSKIKIIKITVANESHPLLANAVNASNFTPLLLRWYNHHPSNILYLLLHLLFLTILPILRLDPYMEHVTNNHALF